MLDVFSYSAANKHTCDRSEQCGPKSQQELLSSNYEESLA